MYREHEKHPKTRVCRPNVLDVFLLFLFPMYKNCANEKNLFLFRKFPQSIVIMDNWGYDASIRGRPE